MLSTQVVKKSSAALLELLQFHSVTRLWQKSNHEGNNAPCKYLINMVFDLDRHIFLEYQYNNTYIISKGPAKVILS